MLKIALKINFLIFLFVYVQFLSYLCKLNRILGKL